MEKYSKYSKEVLEEVVKNCYTLSNVMRSLGLIPRGSNFSRFKKMLIDLNIDTSHFKQPGGGSSSHTAETFINKVLILNGKGWTSHSIKNKLFEFNLIENKCSMCNLLPVWNEAFLVLQLDHIDGNSRNNERSNLRILCPNCHTQTETYSGKKR